MYIKPEDPADDVVILSATESAPKGWTWGDHKAMKKTIDELEANDHVVKDARDKLDARLLDAGFLEYPVLVCHRCRQPQESPHKEDCPDFRDPTMNHGPRWRAGYQFFNEKFEPLHITSIPMDDEEAKKYILKVNEWFPEDRVKYVWARELTEQKYKMLPWVLDVETGKVIDDDSSRSD